MNTKLLVLFLISLMGSCGWIYYLGFSQTYEPSITVSEKEIALKSQSEIIDKIFKKIDKDIVYGEPFLYTAPDSNPTSILPWFKADFDGTQYLNNRISVNNSELNVNTGSVNVAQSGSTTTNTATWTTSPANPQDQQTQDLLNQYLKGNLDK